MQLRALTLVSGSRFSALGRVGLGLAALLVGACDDLGKCDETAARTPVLVGNTVMYAGQAVMVQSCATGCHSSSATGAARLGAPKGLDFDVRPIASTTVSSAIGMRPDGTPVTTQRAVVDDKALAELRSHQRKVYEQRDTIWDQVKDDMMPPTGKGQAFRDANVGALFSYGSSGSCTRGVALEPVSQGSTQSVLRNWLSCGAPVVETQNAGLPYVADDSDAGAGRAAAYPGTVGDQYPVAACTASDTPDGGVGDGGTTDGGGGTGPGSFAAMFAVLDASCNTCHGAAADAFQKGFKLTPAATAYTTLLGADGKGGALASKCGSTTKPYVTPGNADASYLLDKIGDTKGTICGTLMPQGSALSAADIATIRAWVVAGAPPP